MSKDFIDSLVIHLLVFLVFSLSFISFVSQRTVILRVLGRENYQINVPQPTLETGILPWQVRSIDTQVVSKHWPAVPRDSVRKQVGMLKELGVNYIAVGTPYDREEELILWAEEIHAVGLNVWFRSHWAEWEGDEGLPSTMSPEEYLERTHIFILENPDIFKPGDAFTVAVEAENVGVGPGRKFLTWDEYRWFLAESIRMSGNAFKEIGLEGRVHTNWLSMNGWVAENALTQALVDEVGLIVVDHYVGQTKTIGDRDDLGAMVRATSGDLDRLHDKWGVPILLGEWGYQIYQKTDEDRQAQAVRMMLEELKSKEYLVGINYWVHMGNTSSIIDDDLGANLRFRKAAEVIKEYYLPLSTATLTPTPGIGGE